MDLRAHLIGYPRIGPNRELKRANEILKSASVFFAKELDPDRPK